MKNQIRILLVEDEVISAMSLILKLENAGYKMIQHVSTSEEALASIKQNPPDLILMDIRLPGQIDGIKAASIIKSETDIPLIFITGYEDTALREKALKLNPLEYLIKPVDMNKLFLLIESSLNRA